MNRKKLHEKNLARIVEWLTAPDVCEANLPDKVRKEIGNRYRSRYLGEKWRRIEQEAYKMRLFELYETSEYTYRPTWSGERLIRKYYPKFHN